MNTISATGVVSGRGSNLLRGFGVVANRGVITGVARDPNKITARAVIIGRGSAPIKGFGSVGQVALVQGKGSTVDKSFGTISETARIIGWGAGGPPRIRRQGSLPVVAVGVML